MNRVASRKQIPISERGAWSQDDRAARGGELLQSWPAEAEGDAWVS